MTVHSVTPPVPGRHRPHCRASRTHLKESAVAHAINRYKADLREFQFVLFEQFKLQDILGKEPFADWGREEATTVLNEVYRFACEVLGPTNSIGDTEGCRIEDGTVKVPAAFHDAWKKLAESGWKLLGVEPEL